MLIRVSGPTLQPFGDQIVVIHGQAFSARADGERVTQLTALADAPETAPRWTRGFIDLHTHGAAGFGFDDADESGLRAALGVQRRRGTRGSLLSLVSAPAETQAQRVTALSSLLPTLPGTLGIHLEGPFLAPGKRGAHDPQALCAPSAEAVETLVEAGAGAVRMVTIAPELPGAPEAIDTLIAAGIVVAVGHTEADYDTAAAAFDRGASVLTHAFNAMPGLEHRNPGPIGAALGRDHVTLELIADGVHVHPVVLRTLMLAAPGRVALVSDAMAATGLGDGAHRLGSLDVEVRDGTPYVVGTSTIAGSTLTLDRAIEVAVASGVSLDTAVAAVTTVPARALGLAAPSIGVGTPLDAIVTVATA